MESHPSYPILSVLLSQYPKSSSSLFQTYNDIVYAQQWREVEVIDLPTCSRGIIRGKRPDNNDEIIHVIPCSLSETLSFGWLQEAFTSLFPQKTVTAAAAVDNDGVQDEFVIYLAITSSDSSIVYYKLCRGIIKPPV